MVTVPNLVDEGALDQYTATASQTDFVFTYMIFTTADIKVYVNGVLKTETADYEVKQADGSVIIPDSDLPMDGGKIVFNSGLTLNDEVSLSRDIAIARTTDYSTAGAFRSDVVNAEFAKILAIQQQLERDLARSIRLSSSDAEGGSLQLPGGRANNFLAFDAGGNLIMSTGTVGTTPIAVSAFAETLLDDADATAALNTLGVSAFAQTILDDADATAALNTLGAGQALNTLTTITTLENTDQIAVVDNSDSDNSKKITVSNLKSELNLNQATTTVKGFSYLTNPITISNGTDSDYDIDCSAGNAILNDGSAQVVATAETKQLDADWAAGDGNGGMPSTVSKTGTYETFGTAVTGTGTSFDTEFSVGDILWSSGEGEGRRITAITDSTNMTIKTAFDIDVTPGEFVEKNGLAPDASYHVFALADDDNGFVGFGFDTSINAAELLANSEVISAGGTKYYLVASFVTDGDAHIRAGFYTFDKAGNYEFTYGTKILDRDGSPNPTFSDLLLTVPTGLSVKASLTGLLGESGATVINMTVKDKLGGDEVDIARARSSSTSQYGHVRIYTDIDGAIQIKESDNNADTYRLWTTGWSA
ncbi:MAG: hypothetical protein ACPGJI_05465 [Kangiellaceae bacterium]